MAEEPEQVLEQDRAAALVIQRLAHRDHRGHEEAGAEQAVEQHHDGADEQRREGEQGEDRGHEDAPHRERHAEQGHAVGARLQHRGHVVQAAHGGGDDEDRQRNQHQHDAPFGARRALGDRLRWIERPAGTAGPAGDEKAGEQHDHREQVEPVAEHVDVGEHHVPRADHQRDQVVAETAEEQRGQQVDHHDHAVHGHRLVIGAGIHELQAAGEADLHAHQPRQHHGDQADEDRGQGVLDGDDLVVLAPDVAREEALGFMQRFRFGVLRIGHGLDLRERSGLLARLRSVGLSGVLFRQRADERDE
ncbi:hypothetical protein D9M71_413790 [compost metagenome]